MLALIKLRIGLILLSCLIAFSCVEPDPLITQGPTQGPITNTNRDDLRNTDFNILFVGNSLTYTNNLPQLVKAKALEKGIDIGVKSISFPNYAIIDHWDDGLAQTEIKTQLYDYVIVQQGPSSQSFGREVLIDYGKKFNDLCNENDAKLCFFMVWPSLTYYETFDGVIKNYSEAAAKYDAILFPVGTVWKKHFDDTGVFDYYGPDGFHPSALGSQVAAEVITNTLFP